MTRPVRLLQLLRGSRCAAALLIVAGCRNEPPPSAAACAVSPASAADRIVLLSEALAAASSHERFESPFLIVPHGPGPVDLELSAIGCSCYEILHARRTLRIGDRLSVPSGGRCDVRIASRPLTSPGIRQFQADFTARGLDGSQSRVTLACTVRTIADLAVQPDIVSVEFGPAPILAEPVALAIDQHVRADNASGVQTQWGELPAWIACSPPELTDPPIQIAPGLWRLRWRSLLSVTPMPDDPEPPDAPRQLLLHSSHGGRQLTRAACTLIPRRRSGVRAPRLVHFGRIEPGVQPTRRIQLSALDGRRFAVTAAFTRDGAATVAVPNREPAVEHWLEVAVATPGTAIDDLLTIRTDHPTTGELQIQVRAVGLKTGR